MGRFTLIRTWSITDQICSAIWSYCQSPTFFQALKEKIRVNEIIENNTPEILLDCFSIGYAYVVLYYAGSQSMVDANATHISKVHWRNPPSVFNHRELPEIKSTYLFS